MDNENSAVNRYEQCVQLKQCAQLEQCVQLKLYAQTVLQTRASLRGSRFFILFLLGFFNFNIQAQELQIRDDSFMAQEYVRWIQQAINEDRWNDAAAALIRASDFEGVSSDISYLNAVSNNFFNADRNLIILHLDNAIETNRWVAYSVNQALLLKAQMLIAVRNYQGAVNCLDAVGFFGESNVQMRSDAAMIRLAALRGIALNVNDDGNFFLPSSGNIQVLSQFRSLVLTTMDSYPRDARPLRIFFEYARNRMPEQSDLPESDINLLEFVLRRLPSLLETDPELAWMAAPFMRDLNEARRLLSQYRAGGISQIQNRDFRPNPASIPAALNLGLIDDFTAAQELFSGSRAFNNPLPPGIVPDGNPVLDRDIIAETYRLLRSEEGRSFFMQKLLSFTGIITCDEDRDGYVDRNVYYHSGIIRHLSYDRDQNNIYDLIIEFDANGVPYSAMHYLAGQRNPVIIEWERYPFVRQAVLGGYQEGMRITNHSLPHAAPSPGNNSSPDSGIFRFGFSDFLYAPVNFIRLGGSRSLTGLDFPEIAFQNINLTYRSLASFCSSFTRASAEIDGAQETVYMNRGVLLQSVETMNGRPVSVTEFERGLPVIQYIDLDLDGRMETIRSFRRPPQNYVWNDFLDYRRLMSSSESDWRGDGRFKTMEVYQNDGSVVYYFDLDGSGSYNFTETRR